MKTVNYRKPGFISKFLELNKVMWTTNAGLTDSHPYDSRPSSWIWLRRGISFWGKDQKHIYLIGNWFTWYMSSFSIVLYAAIRVLLVIRDKRGYRDNFRGMFAVLCAFFLVAATYCSLPPNYCNDKLINQMCFYRIFIRSARVLRVVGRILLYGVVLPLPPLLPHGPPTLPPPLPPRPLFRHPHALCHL